MTLWDPLPALDPSLSTMCPEEQLSSANLDTQVLCLLTFYLTPTDPTVKSNLTNSILKSSPSLFIFQSHFFLFSLFSLLQKQELFVGA